MKLVIGCLLFISLSFIPDPGKTVTKKSGPASTEFSKSSLPGQMILRNISFTTDRHTPEYMIVTAAFDIDSEIDTKGEIYILTDGKYPANGRLLIRKGNSHYSLEFLLPHQDHGSSFTADIKLKSSGMLVTEELKQFRM